MIFPLVGPSYTSQSVNAAAQLTMNLYVERIEVPDVSPEVLYSTPGIAVFADLGDTPVRGEIIVNDRCFAIGGANFCEVFSDGTTHIYGTIPNDSKVVSMAGGTSQILIATVGIPFVFDLVANTLTQLPGGTLIGMVSFVGYADGFFIALLANSNQFQWSKVLDATTWDPVDTARVSVFTGNVLSMLVDHREIWFFGERQTQPYGDVGAPDQWDVIPGGFIENGIFAPSSPVRIDNSIMWLGGDERGAGVVWRANGYTPVRMSNHAVEFAMQGYLQKYGPTGLSDAVGYAYQDQGHSFYVLFFKTANATWVYDTATNQWHQRGAWNAVNGFFTAHRSQCHVFAFGKHLVGDWASGKIYEMSIALYDDAGSPKRWVRRAMHLSNEQQRQYHSQLQIYLESGSGPQPPFTAPDGTSRGPQINLRWSDDGGHAWSNERTADCGQSGEYKKRVMFRRLGKTRDRVYEISGSDPIPWRIIGAYLQASGAE